MNIYYKLEDFKALNLDINEYQKGEIIKANKLAEEVSKFHPATMVIEVEKYGTGIYYEQPHVFLDQPNVDYKVTIRYLDYNKHYSISEYNGFGRMDYITPHDKHKNDFTNNLNKIGKLSAKKIQDYLNAIEQTYKALTTLSNERIKKVEAFKKKLEGLPVNFWNEGRNGQFSRGGLNYYFSIEDNGYIKEEIRTDFVSGLDSFLKMSDNKF